MRLHALTVPLLALGLGAVSLVGLRAQTSGATRIIDIIATDTNGAPLTTLQSQDVMLRLDGRVHPILDLRLVRPNAEPAAMLPAPYASNQIASGRSIAVVVDVTRLQQTDAPQVQSSIGAVLGTLNPRDRISVVALAEDGFTTDYTSRPELVRAMAAKLPATAPLLDDAKTLEAAAVASLTLLERQCASLATDPGHKILVLIAPPFAPSAPVRRAIQSLAAVAARQRIQLVVIDPRGGETTSPGLAALAAATGGTALPLTDNLPSRLAAVAGPSAARYLLQFTVTNDEQDEKLHRVQLVSLRQDAQVTAAAQVFIPKRGAAADPLAALTDMLRQPRAWRDLPLRLAVFPVLDVERDRLRLLVLGEPEEQSRPLAWAEFALIAPSGAVVAEWKAEGADLATRPIMTSVLAPPGPYRLRMAASELTGRRGAVDDEFDARLAPAGTLTLGPMMFGGVANQAFQPMLLPPAGAPAVMAYVEVYGRPAGTDTLAARFEVSPTATGPPVATVTGSVRTTPSDDRRAALGTIDLATLAPGDYQVQAIITLNGAEIGRVNRTLRKVAQ